MADSDHSHRTETLSHAWEFMTTSCLFVHLLPQVAPAEHLAQTDFVVVIDIIRASTTIAHALASGARCVVPCATVEDAKSLAAEFETSQRVLGGEREGLKIEGFDLGNSPSEYTAESVAERTVLFTTTNGTKAMMACRDAVGSADQRPRLLVSGFVNLAATLRLLEPAQSITLLCAGTRGVITREDALFAGAVVEMLTSTGDAQGDAFQLNDEARLAQSAWREVASKCSPPADLSSLRSTLADELCNTTGGENLQKIRLQGDLIQAAEIDRFGDFVPEIDWKSWTIVAR